MYYLKINGFISDLLLNRYSKLNVNILICKYSVYFNIILHVLSDCFPDVSSVV